MEAAGVTPERARTSQRAVAVGGSLALHAAVLVLAVSLAGHRRDTQPPRIELTQVEVVEPPPVVPPAPRPEPLGGGGNGMKAPTSGIAGALGRRGHDAPQRSPHAVPVHDPYADLAVRYDARVGPDPGNENGPGGPGLGASLAGDGTDRFSGGPLHVPLEPGSAKSLARPPKPKAAYKDWAYRAPTQFAGSIIRLELKIDPDGSVHDVTIRKSVDPMIDDKAVAFARSFQFFPALNELGTPIWGLYRWEFVLESTGLRVPRF